MNSPDKILSQLKIDIDNAMQELSEGKLVDMQLIDDNVKVFCESIRKLDGESARAYIPKLSELIEHITYITDRLGYKRDNVEKSMDGNISRQKAHNAYNSTSIITNEGG